MVKLNKQLFILFIFVLSLRLDAGVIKSTDYFSKIGEVASFQWAPQRYESEFRYDIFYYIPKALENSQQVPALIFNHGGGSSTLTREGSIATVNKYLPKMIEIAENLGIVLILPSANGLNWGGHTRGLMRELAELMKNHLNIDSDRIGLAGHSMGGMGITRSYSMLADEFSFFLPLGAGMDEAIQLEQHLNKVFNVPYVHLQGLKDHFEVFITRCQEHLKRVAELEQKFSQKSLFEMIFYDGNHQMDQQLTLDTLKRLFMRKRNLYQKTLFATVHTVSQKRTENEITFDLDSEPRYFWLELSGIDLTNPETVSFFAQIRGNKIEINMPTYPQQSKELLIYLSHEMINLEDYVEIYLNGNLVKLREPSLPAAQVMDHRDPGFVFNDKLVISLH